MRRGWLLLLSLAFLATACWSLAMAVRRVPADDLVAKQRFIELGNIRQGKSGYANYVLINDSHNKLLIDQVLPSCGCTVATLPADLLEPGESVECRVTYSAGSRRGRSSNFVQVLYRMGDEKRTRSLQLEFVAYVQPDFDVFPAGLRFEESRAETKELRLNPINMKKLVITNVYCTHPAFRARVIPSDQGSDELVAEVTFDSSRWRGKSGDSLPQMIVHTNSQNEPIYYSTLEVVQ